MVSSTVQRRSAIVSRISKNSRRSFSLIAEIEIAINSLPSLSLSLSMWLVGRESVDTFLACLACCCLALSLSFVFLFDIGSVALKSHLRARSGGNGQCIASWAASASPPRSLPVSRWALASFWGRAAEAHARPGKGPRVTLAVVELPRGGEEIARRPTRRRVWPVLFPSFSQLAVFPFRDQSRRAFSRRASDGERRHPPVPDDDDDGRRCR